VEIALDVDLVLAACPQCDIRLVEADTTDSNDLGLSVNATVGLGANEVSNSYGAFEQTTLGHSAVLHSHPGVAILTGDFGYGVPLVPAVERRRRWRHLTGQGIEGTRPDRDGVARRAADARPGSPNRPDTPTPTDCPGRMIADTTDTATAGRADDLRND
jgi:hypothetical protein